MGCWRARMSPALIAALAVIVPFSVSAKPEGTPEPERATVAVKPETLVMTAFQQSTACPVAEIVLFPFAWEISMLPLHRRLGAGGRMAKGLPATPMTSIGPTVGLCADAGAATR